MLRLIMGRARSGKSRRIRELLAERVHAGGKVLLIVPEQYSFESEKNLLDLLGPENQSNVEILYTFTSLSRELLDAYKGGRRPPLKGAAKDAVMSLTLRELSHELSIFDECYNNPTEVHELTLLIEELYQNGITYETLIEAADKTGDDRVFTKAKELSLISDAYKAITEETHSDTRYDLDTTADIIIQNELFRDTTIFIDEFYGFTKPELTVICSLLKNAFDVYITAVCESISKGYPTDALAFPQNTVRELLSLADRSDIAAAEPEILIKSDRYVSPAIEAVEQNIFSIEEYEPYEGPGSDAVTIAAANTPYDECDYIAAEAKRLVRETGIRYRDIAVIERGSVYSAYLPFAFSKYDIPVFKDRRKPLTAYPLIRYAAEAVKLAADGISTDGIFSLLKTYLSGVSQEDIYELENYVFVWNISSLAWTKPFTRNPSGFGKTISDSDRSLLDRLNFLRERIINGIYDLRSGLNNSDGTGACKAVYDYLIANKADKTLLEYARGVPEEDAIASKRSWDILMDTLTELADVIGNRKIDSKVFSSLFNIMCSSSDTGEMPSGLDEITVSSADRARLTDKKVLFIAGANEKVFPSGEPDGFALTSGERRELIRAGAMLRQYGQTNAQRERFLFYSAVSKPSERLYICYSHRNYTSGELQPSEPVLAIREIIPGCNFRDSASVPPEHRIESKRSALLSAAAHSHVNSVFSRTVSDYILNGQDGEYFKFLLLSGAKPETVFQDASISKRLFEGLKTFTPSQIEKFIGCAFSYFCRYGMKAYPLEPAKYDNRINGNVIHSALESIFRKYGSEGLLSLSYHDFPQVAQNAVQEYIVDNIGTDHLDARTRYSVSKAIDTVSRMLRSIVEELKNSDYHTRGVEVRIGFGGDVPPYSILLPDGSKVFVGGTVDRVDTYQKENKRYIRVLDYKTGSKELKLEDIFSGINLQMPVYLNALTSGVKNNLQNSPDSPLPAAAFYVPASVTKPKLKRNDPESKVILALADQDKLSGMVIQYPEMSIDSELRDQKPGAYKAFSLTREQYDRLQEIVNGKISDMAISLYKGAIDANPLKIRNRYDPCKYCDYKSVCRHEDGDRHRNGFSGDPYCELNKGDDKDD